MMKSNIYNNPRFNKAFVEGFARLFFEDAIENSEKMNKEKRIIVIQN